MRFLWCTILLFLGQQAFAQIENLNDLVVVGETFFIGNEKTKKFVLERELAYQVGDTLSKDDFHNKVVRSRENIFNTSLFNKTTFEVSFDSNGLANVTFILEERWYVWPYPILENGDRNFNTWWETKDFNRLSYGIFLNWYNFRGRNETFQVMTKIGFENQFSIGYDIPNLNKKKTLGLYVSGGVAGYREVNYTSDLNKREFYKSEDGPGRQVNFAKVQITYRKGLNFRHRVGLMYTYLKVDSAITHLANDYLKNNQTKSEYFTLSYYGKFDTRDYMDYPLKGYKIETYINQYGLGILDNEQLNVLTTTLGVYWHLPLGGRWNFANSVVGKTTFFDSTPYSIQQGLGYTNYVRGYELYVMDAEKYMVTKANLKFNILKKKQMHLTWLPMEKFNKPYFAMYINAFVDVGFAEDKLYGERNLLSNKWAYGYGLGLDITAFYDFVMRIEYAFNRENQSGVYLHFKKSI
ncbi:MAG: POTRA domain-containing protein [Salibacteraceae bacterium]